MKILRILTLLLLTSSLYSAQNKLIAYEYWFNNDYLNKQIIDITPDSVHELNTDFDASSFADGVNVFNIRYIDENGKYSSTLSKAFVKNSLPAVTQRKLVAYEYWFNNDFSNKQVIEFTPSATQEINTNFDVSILSTGVNIFNIRYIDENGKYSSTLSKAFVKSNTPSVAEPKLVAYEYWFNNNFSNKQVVEFTPNATHNLNMDFDVSSLSMGVNVFNIRYKDEFGKYSSIFNKVFVKQTASLHENKITGWRYWFDNDINNAINAPLNPEQEINLVDKLDMSKLPKGMHELNYQLKDSAGNWSVVMTSSIEKISFPIANFSYNSTFDCDSTKIEFANKSLDGDTFVWNFGDGSTDSVANPTHIYRTPGSYLVSLTITDTLTMADSTQQTTIEIKGNTAATINATACNTYTSPSGKYTYTNSGTYFDTIPNRWGCDSTITLNLSINTANTNVTQSGNTLSSEASATTYEWLDCNNGHAVIAGENAQTFTATQNGSYALKITQNGCTDSSACYTIETLDIIENSFKSNIVVYPNPTDGFISVKMGEPQNSFYVSIIDTGGKVLKQSTFTNTDSFNMHLNIPSGIYLLKINSGNKKATIRLIRN